MRPKSHHAIIVAATVVSVAAALGIAAIEGWLPLWPARVAPTSVAASFAGTAPPDSLSPGESIVTAADVNQTVPAVTAVLPAPAPIPSAPPPESTTKPVPKTPAHERAPAVQGEQRGARGPCANCGNVSSTTFRQAELQRGGAWEVRVRFDDGTRATLRFPTDPGFRVGERVIFANGRLHRD